MSNASPRTPAADAESSQAGLLADAIADGVLHAWDGAALLAALGAATAWLGANRDAVNALNVFPVPDGDTGTNMLLTMRAALDEARNLPESLQSDASEVAARIAHGALMGARGNSGVILSQVFRGIANGLADRPEIDGSDIARALLGARDMAYRAVMKPVEGTMLTVVRVAAERAEVAASDRADLRAVLAAASAGAVEALATTPDLLDILKQAGVVDAGGQGIVHILEGIGRFARGESLEPPPTENGHAGLGGDMAFLDQLDALDGDDAFGYCTNFMIFGDGIDFDRARSDMAEMGDSAVIVGDDRIVKVHIHVINPGKVLDYAVGLGELGQIKIDNMQSQTRLLSAQRSTATAPAEPADAETHSGTIAILAVASGDGLAAVLRSMGAAGIVLGGQTENPSTRELLVAAEALSADEVILLPNNPNILLAAAQVAGLTQKTVRVVPSRSVPQGLSALEAFNPDADIAGNVARMTEALGFVRTIEVTRAVRDAVINGVTVTEGDVIALIDDRLAASGSDENDVTCRAFAEADLGDAELATIFLGDGVTAADAGPLEAAILAMFPDLVIETHAGGQPHYRFIIGVQ